MDEKLAAAISAAPASILTEIVKLAQRLGNKGTKGTWKDFLNVYDTKFGSSLSDPGKRPREALVSFLQTFTGEEEQKLHTYHSIPWDSFIMQKLVNLTLGHPFYMSKYMFPSHQKDWLVTKPCNKSKLASSNKILAVDCEMVLCEDGTDALARVCVVDCDLEVKLDEKVNPNKPIADYRTKITGINPGDLDEVKCSLRAIQRRMKKLLSRGQNILVGHGLYNDLLALKIDHARVIDTSLIFKNSNGRIPSLRGLCKAILGYELREENAPHNCLDDAQTAMKIVLETMKLGIDKVIPKIASEVKHVPEDKLATLLLHKIPSTVPAEKLKEIFPANFTIQLEDTAGLQQKYAKLVSDTGKTSAFFVRKMLSDDYIQALQQKRTLEVEDRGGRKKRKTDCCDSHLEEIERLKQELKAKDEAHVKEIEKLRQEAQEKAAENLSDEHLKEIEILKKEIRVKDIEIRTSDKIIASLKKKRATTDGDFRGREQGRKPVEIGKEKDNSIGGNQFESGRSLYFAVVAPSNEMENANGGGALAGDDSSSSSSPAAVVSQWTFAVTRRYQHLLDKTVPHIWYRWIACFVAAAIYGLRVYFVEGFYIVTYGLGIYMLNLLIGFLSPQIDPEVSDGPALPTRGSDEFRPFVRRLPEFKFWYSITKAFFIAFWMTFFAVFDVPVFWPILLFYWIMLFILTMRRQIMHMVKYKYVPFSFGKQVEILEGVEFVIVPGTLVREF
ncbi:Small RNA degrading nuclease 3 [Linum perenne]